jgi:predicted phage terminase large subunit-like protein
MDQWLETPDNQLADWLREAKAIINRMPERAKEVRQRARDDLYYFARLVNPGYMYGEVHREIFRWMEEYTLFGIGDDLTSNKLVMLPRAHLKSHMVATWCAWIILRHPEVTMLYVSATAELAEVQLYAVQNIIDSTTFRRFFPEYIHPQDGLREKWNTKKMIIDHPARVGVRDATIATAGLTTNTTGWHADIILADDLVVPENAYTEDGREAVSKKASQFTSIRNAGGFTMACGTRYHPNDIYAVWKQQTYPIYNELGEQLDILPVWEIKEYVVEQDGIFIWPRVVRSSDSKAFGFDLNILSRIKAEYSDITQFHAQYYNDPNDPSSNRIGRDKFQYYNPRLLRLEGSRWQYNGKRLNIYAAVDFAFSLNRGSDYTAIVVIGIDSDSNIFVLDIERFKTNKVIEYFKKIAELHSKWRFNKMQAEVTVAQEVIVESIKDYIKQRGLTLTIVPYRPSRQEGSKEQRIAAALESRYEDDKMWHFEGGWTNVLEDELVQARPAHDDIKDALASAVTIAVKPQRSAGSAIVDFLATSVPRNRFGGFGGV